jgi:branched-chain amino acid transport system substrate-binding protein
MKILIVGVSLLLLTACGGANNGADGTPDRTGPAATASPTDTAGDGATDSPESQISALAAAVLDLQGPAAFAGLQIREGMEFALEHLLARSEYSGILLDIEFMDGQTDPQAALAATNRVVNGGYVAMFGPILSSSTLAAVPLAQEAGLPVIVIEGGAPGVVETGEYIFRVTPPQITLVARGVQHLRELDAEKVALLHQSDNPTLVALRDAYVEALADQGMEVVLDTGFPGTTSDFSTVAAQVVATEADAVGVAAIGGLNATVVSQLRQAGFEGHLFGSLAAAGGSLASVAEEADGFFWASPFGRDSGVASMDEFSEAFLEATGSPANHFHAEGYDGVLMLLEALRVAGTATREAVRDGLESVASTGFSGAQGLVDFEARDARVPGVVVEFKGGEERAAASS